MSALAPVALVDKSFLQSLPMREAAIFDGLFTGVIPPILLTEIVSDLAKDPEDAARSASMTKALTEKLPEVRGVVNSFHEEAAMWELLGNRVELVGRPLLSNRDAGRLVNGHATMFDRTTEIGTLGRWREGRFTEQELDFALWWRRRCSAFPKGGGIALLVEAGQLPPRCASLQEAAQLARRLVETSPASPEVVFAAIRICNLVPALVPQAWTLLQGNAASLRSIAPYVAHLVQVEAFYRLLVHSGLTPPDPKKTCADYPYLFYLPFCGIFVSSDRFHERTAGAFIGPKQEFVKGSDILKELTQIGDQLEAQGVGKAPRSPLGFDVPIINGIWDRQLPGWRKAEENKPAPQTSGVPKAIDEAIASGKVKTAKEVMKLIEDLGGEGFVIKRVVRKKRGGLEQAY